MCLILDANMFGDFSATSEDMKPVVDWIKNKGGKIVYSATQKFQRELNDSPVVKKLFDGYREAGKLKLMPAEEVSSKVNTLNGLVSDDKHIIALAMVSGCTLLASKDKALGKDFKNNNFIRGGKIYKNQSHKRLLTKKTCP